MRIPIRSRLVTLAALAIAAPLLVASHAGAETTATATSTITPRGAMFKEVRRPVNATITATINPGPGAATLDGLVESKLHQTPDLAYVPDPKQPTCSFTEASADVPVDTARAMCPDAIVGNGVSTLYVAQSVAAFVTDPIVTIFNGPPDKGNGVLVMQAYSAATNHGITFGGQLKNGILDVRMPRLTYDSSIPSFTLSTPGDIGQNPTFAQASCSTGSYTSFAEFTLGDRDAGGTLTNESKVSTQPYVQSCTGKTGNPSFSLKVKGPKSVKSGKKGAFKVTVTNKGTATSKVGTVSASGAGKGSVGLLPLKPGDARTVTLKAKVTGKKGKTVSVKIKASGGASASGNAKVKVR